MNCIFCQIVKGIIPATRVFEDELVFCFLDIAPITPGHSLIIPKEHHTSLTTVPAHFLARMMTIAPALAQAITRVTDGDGFNLHLSNGQCAGQVVPHVHLHVIPRSPTDGFTWGWRSGKYENPEQARELGAKIRARFDKMTTK